MTELPDDELDKLFRKSSEELDPQFDPEDWNSLRKRLDAHDGKFAGGWLRKWWPLGLLALLIPAGFAVYFFTKSPVSESVNTKPDASVTTGRQSQQSADSPVSGAKKEVNAPVKSSEQASADVAEEVNIAKPLTDKNPAITKRKAGPPSQENSSLRDKEAEIAKSSSDLNITDYQRRKKLPRSQSKTGGVYLEPNRSKQEGGDGAFSIHNIEKNQSAEPIFADNAVREDVGNEKISEEQARLLISAAMLSSRTLNWENQPEVPTVAFSAPSATEAPEPEKSEEDYAKWAVRLGYSPDLSTVGFKNYTKPGVAFSLLLEYALMPRLYLQSGLIWSRKDYYANAGEYELMEYVTKYNTPYGVDGECIMFEVPLGLRYNVMQKEQSRLFVGAGVSSYYAQKEKYKYHYAKYVHDQKPGWSGKTGLFLLSHINASVGYERTITKKLSLVAEPYIRIPIKGVGYGKVNLMTVGAWISLRYTPAFK